jgi:hypothetical protein
MLLAFASGLVSALETDNLCQGLVDDLLAGGDALDAYFSMRQRKLTALCALPIKLSQPFS